MADITDIQDLQYVQPTTATNPVLKLLQAVNATDTTIRLNFEPKDEDGASITKDFFIGVKRADGYIETMKVTNVSGTTLTVVRGIALGGLDFDTTVTANGVAHTAGEQITFNLPAGLFQMVTDSLLGNIGSTYKLNARPSYSGTDAVHSDRVFADATARDAAITSPTNGDRCYNTATGTFQKYQSGAWADDASGTTVNATTTVAGKVELATTAETQAGTDTGGSGASLIALPSDIATNVQDAKYTFAADAEASDTYAITLVPAPSAYATGQSFYFSANTANTGAATLNVNALGAKTIKKFHDQDLEDNDIESGSIVHVIYDGTNLQLQTPVATNMTSAEADTLTGGGTTDANGLHRHLRTFGSGLKSVAATSDTLNITHNLGTTPNWIKIEVKALSLTSSTPWISDSTGEFDGTTYGTIYGGNGYDGAGDPPTTIGFSSTKILFVIFSDGTSTTRQIDATATIASTQIQLSFANSSASSRNVYYKWEAGV